MSVNSACVAGMNSDPVPTITLKQSEWCAVEFYETALFRESLDKVVTVGKRWIE
jgi:hypothetical protein